MIEWVLDVSAQYGNPFDQREVDLSATFTAPSGSEMKVAGFWDGASDWRIRFNPATSSIWQYSFLIEDGRGVSDIVEGTFNVSTSSKK